MGGGHALSSFLHATILEVDPLSAYLAHVAAGKIEIRQLTPDRRFTGAGPETDGPAKARGNCRVGDGGEKGVALLSHGGAQGNKRAQVTARRERSHVPGFENGPSRLPRVI